MNLPQLPYCWGCGYVLLTSLDRCVLALASGGAFSSLMCVQIITHTQTQVCTHTHIPLGLPVGVGVGHKGAVDYPVRIKGHGTHSRDRKLRNGESRLDWHQCVPVTATVPTQHPLPAEDLGPVEVSASGSLTGGRGGGAVPRNLVTSSDVNNVFRTLAWALERPQS